MPPGVLERGLLLKMRFELDHALNLRPVKLPVGVESPIAAGTPESIDMVVCREGTEGSIAGRRIPAQGHGERGRHRGEHQYGTASNVWCATHSRARRPVRAKKLTLVHKTNVLVHAGNLYQRVVNHVAEEFPEVSVDYCHIDAATIFFVTDPGRFDVIVTDNMFGDILTDIGAAIAGGIGLAASGNVNIDGTAPSMFEPVHGSAPDIAGRARRIPPRPSCQRRCCSTTLVWLLRPRRLKAAVAVDLAARGSEQRSTSQIGDALTAAVSGS